MSRNDKWYWKLFNEYKESIEWKGLTTEKSPQNILFYGDFTTYGLGFMIWVINQLILNNYNLKRWDYTF